MPDGSVILVEIAEGQITRVHPDGSKTVVAKPGGGPNGLAIGPDGKLYCCNNGGFEYMEANGFLAPHGIAQDYSGGRIERIDIDTGEVEILYKSGDHGCSLRGPNDIVFDAHGGFWFTDHGTSSATTATYGGLFYAKADGSSITCVRDRMTSPNGVGLSPDEKTVYMADTMTGRLWAFGIEAPGKIAEGNILFPGRVVATLPNYQLLDSLAVEAGGKVCVATIVNGGITAFDPAGEETFSALGTFEHYPLPDVLTTNICFGGADMQDAWVTCSGTGTLYKMRWPRPGLRLNFAA
jgi:gluconolactonase